MKRNLQFFLTATTASLLALTALAEDNNSAVRTDRPAQAGDRLNDPNSGRPQGAANAYPNANREYGVAHANSRAERLQGAAKASEIIGITVKNYQDEKLGTVEDLAVDLESGRIVQVILSTGGFLGVGERLSAVPPGALHHDIDKKVLHLDANKEKLKGAPELKAANWAEASNRENLSAVYSYYGQESAFGFVQKDDNNERTGQDLRRGDNNDRTNQELRRGDNNDRTNQDLRRRDNNDPTGNTTTTRNADGTWSRSRSTGERQWMIPSSRLGQIQKASTLMGMDVKNRQDEQLGKVENILVDMASGRVVAVVVSSGGFLGMGDELSAVPPTALSFGAGRDTLQLDRSKEQLAAAPHFASGNWPDFNQPAYSHSVYRAYEVDPYFTTNSVTDVDNASRNARDRDDRTLTPFDQGNTQADTDTTAQIRKGILAGKDMSVNARNVKIVTNNGRVTLRGPVKNAEEKRLIGEIADRIARSGNVDNQLEIVRNSSN